MIDGMAEVNGSKWFLKDGVLHRNDGPAIEDSDGATAWYHKGHLHREDGPAIECVDGHKEWWINGKRHREDGPAIIGKHGDTHWYRNGKPHREDGPAIKWAGGIEWYLDGSRLTEEEFNQWLAKKSLNEKLQETLEPRYKDKKKKI